MPRGQLRFTLITVTSAQRLGCSQKLNCRGVSSTGDSHESEPQVILSVMGTAHVECK